MLMVLACEVPAGFEPANKGVADLCLTTWLWYRLKILMFQCKKLFAKARVIIVLLKYEMLKDFIPPRVGLEPTTPRLTAVCSTIELSRKTGGLARGTHPAARALKTENENLPHP